MTARQQPCEDREAQLIDCAMGVLADAERAELLQHTGNCRACRAELDRRAQDVGTLSGSLADPRGRERTWERLRERLFVPPTTDSVTKPLAQAWKSWSPTQGYLPASDETWEATGVEGVEARSLFVAADRSSTTMLVRMAPGARFPAHRHAGIEQCYVIAGDLVVGERTMTAGDFEVVEEASIHPEQHTTQGCTLLISCSMHDELL